MYTEVHFQAASTNSGQAIVTSTVITQDQPQLFSSETKIRDSKYIELL